MLKYGQKEPDPDFFDSKMLTKTTKNYQKKPDPDFYTE
jgi:hypothetical protein